MQARVNVITLAVTDLERSLSFYRDGLGWKTNGIVGQEFHDELTDAGGAIAFFEMHGGLKLALYEKANLAKDAHVKPDPQSKTEFSLIYIASSKREVDAILQNLQRAGGRLTAPPHKRPFGFYSGYVEDPDGHLWEIGTEVESD
ncbi:MAG: VOC family protein [Candidatus Eremiobacteraeota bacterium]|nr:VOC family protein [Candidatus Eremiobacteraeota bacterium]